MLPCVVFQIPKQNLKSSHLYILWCLLLLRYLEDCLFLPRIYCIPVPENTVGNVPKNTVQDFPIFTVFLIPVYTCLISSLIFSIIFIIYLNFQSLFNITANGYVYETFGISKLFLVKLQLLLIRAETLGNQLTAKCYIYDVVGMFIILILFFSFPKNIFRWH